MARLALNKASLQRERAHLATFRRFLPSLDLKRKQLMQQLATARGEVKRRIRALEEAMATVGERLPMLAIQEIDLTGLVAVSDVEVREINRLGVTVPVIDRVDFTVRDYALLGKPHWVDRTVEEVKRVAEERLQLSVAEEVVRRLDKAVRRITQRVNLFEKVLIPTAQDNIKRIQIFLGDAERAAVVRSKIAKSKHAEDEEPLPLADEAGEGGGIDDDPFGAPVEEARP